MGKQEQFLKYVQNIWNKPDAYVISYLKAANRVKFDADIDFLIMIRMTK